MEAIITIKDRELIDRVQELLDSRNVVVSETAPTISSPFPLWIYKGTMKVWVGNRWRNVGECKDPTTSDFRIVENGVLRRID